MAENGRPFNWQSLIPSAVAVAAAITAVMFATEARMSTLEERVSTLKERLDNGRFPPSVYLRPSIRKGESLERPSGRTPTYFPPELD